MVFVSMACLLEKGTRVHGTPRHAWILYEENEMVNDPKKNGSTLMAIGGIAMAMTVAGLFVAFRSVQTSGSAAALAEGISAALMPLAGCGQSRLHML
jgi:hypothetical protein